MRSVPNRSFLTFLPPHCFSRCSAESLFQSAAPVAQPWSSPGASPQASLTPRSPRCSSRWGLPRSPGRRARSSLGRWERWAAGLRPAGGDTAAAALTGCERPARTGAKRAGECGRGREGAGAGGQLPAAAPRRGAQRDGNVPAMPRKLCGHGPRRRYDHASAFASVAGRGSVCCGRRSREGCVRSRRSSGKEDFQPSLDKRSLLSPGASHKACPFSSGHLGR